VVVRADGAVALGDKVGSIHRMGALAQGQETCNGWTFWHIEKDGKLICIDDMRSEMRAQMRES
jgi:modification methylase